MMHEIKLITKGLQKTSIWSGGKTTEIAIYPPESQYSQRDFLWRLSSASVEAEESTFTKLPGYDRHLMILEGELKIVHKDQHTALLKKYDKDFFKGEWDTVSFGKAKDFNLMVRKGAKGNLQQVDMQEAQHMTIELTARESRKCFFGCYCNSGSVKLDIGGEEAVIREGELLLIRYDDNLKVRVEDQLQKMCSLVFAYIEV